MGNSGFRRIRVPAVATWKDAAVRSWTKVGLGCLGLAVVLTGCSASPQATRRSSTTTTRPSTTTSSTSTTAPSPTTSSSTTPVAVSVTLPVVDCPTVFGAEAPSTTAPLPTSEQVSVPASLVGGLAFYSDSRRLTVLLGPKGWSCSAQYGADGSGGVIVYPNGQSVPQHWGAGWSLPSTSSEEAISSTETGGSPVQAAAQACPFFPVAATAYQNDLGRPCPARPSAEAVQQISADVVGFEDPAGTDGAGIPSGGQNPANGVVTYVQNASSDPSYLATCTLPDDEHGLCTAVLNEEVARYGTQ